MSQAIPPGFVRLADQEPIYEGDRCWVGIPLRDGRWHLVGADWDDEIEAFTVNGDPLLGDLPKDADIDLIWTSQLLVNRADAEMLLNLTRDPEGTGSAGTIGNPGGETKAWRQQPPVNGAGDELTPEQILQGIAKAGMNVSATGQRFARVELGDRAGSGGMVRPIESVGNGSDREYWVQLGPISYSNGCGGGTGTAKAPESNAWADHFYAKKQSDGDDQTP